MGLEVKFAQCAAGFFKHMASDSRALPPGATRQIAEELGIFAEKMSRGKGPNWNRMLSFEKCNIDGEKLIVSATLFKKKPNGWIANPSPNIKEIPLAGYGQGANPNLGEDLRKAYSELLQDATNRAKIRATELRDKISLGKLTELAENSDLLPKKIHSAIAYIIGQCNPKGDLYKVSQALQKVNKTAKELGIPLEIRNCYLGTKEAPTLTLGLKGMADAVQNVEISKYRGDILPTIAEDLEAAARKLATQHTAQKSTIIEQGTLKALDDSAIEKYFA